MDTAKTLKALIVDDEINCRSNLEMILDEYCPEVTDIVLAGSAADARKVLESYDPDVVFLDIKMPEEDGFQFLDSLEEKNFSVVFTTAHNEYAIKAFKVNAIDYIQKPLDIEEVKDTVSRLVEKRIDGKHNDLETIKSLVDQVLTNRTIDTIAIPTTSGYTIAKCDEVVHLEADESYTTVYLTDNRKLVSSKNIKSYEKVLNPSMFFRVHKSHIINIGRHLTEFNRNEGNVAVMSNGDYVPVARRKLTNFLSRINTL